MPWTTHAGATRSEARDPDRASDVFERARSLFESARE
jgi:hypothetical protein